MQFKKYEIKDLTVELMGKWIAYCASPDKDSLDQHISTVSIFYDIPRNEVYTEIDVADVIKMSIKAVDRVEKIRKLDKPAFTVSIDGRTFKMNEDLSKVKVGKVVDIKKLGKDIINDPAYMLAVLYDETGTDILDRKAKKELFKTKFPVNEFISVSAFFLSASEILKLIILADQNEKLKEMTAHLKRATGSTGRMRSISCRRILTVTWTSLRICTIQLFYFGKNFSFRKVKRSSSLN